jgi:hypothetical protein
MMSPKVLRLNGDDLGGLGHRNVELIELVIEVGHEGVPLARPDQGPGA